MDSKQNSFDELFKLWNEQTSNFLKDSKAGENMIEQFTQLQAKILSIYDAQQSQQRADGEGSADPNTRILSNIYDAIINLTNRVSQLENRLAALEENRTAAGSPKHSKI